MNAEIDRFLEAGNIRSSSASVASKILFVPKKNGKLRMCVDFRNLNEVTHRDWYPLPIPRDVVEMARHQQWFNALDLESAFYVVRI
jgi:hypothetical protein